MTFFISSGTMETKGNIMGRDVKNLAKWRKENLRAFTIRLNKTNEKDVIDYLESKPNLRQYLIWLIRKDMNGAEFSETTKSGQTEDN